MGISTEQLRNFVIKPTLKQLGVYSKAAENLLLGTAAQESSLGLLFKQRYQHGIGLYQITPQRHLKVWDTFLAFNAELASQIRGFASQHEFLSDPHAELATNLRYATAIAWMIYQQADIELPKDSDDIEALAELWHKCFHSRTSTESSCFVENYHEANNSALAA